MVFKFQICVLGVESALNRGYFVRVCFLEFIDVGLDDGDGLSKFFKITDIQTLLIFFAFLNTLFFQFSTTLFLY